MRNAMLLISLFAASVTACGSSGTGTTSTGGTGGTGGENTTKDSSALTGHVAEGSGIDVVGFGGVSALASTVKVSASTIDADGSVTSVITTSVTATGSYSIDVPIHAGPTLVQGLNAKGEVVVSALLEDTLVAGATLMVQPMTTESSVEAAVLLSMVKSGMALGDIDLVGLRASIDTATATVVHDHAADVVAASTADVHALAVATMSAQASQQASFKAAVIDWKAYLAAELVAADTLTAALNESGSATIKANADFTATLAGLGGKLGMDANEVASAATNASASASLAIADASSSVALKGAFDHTQAMLESVAVTAAITEAFTKADASASIMGQLGTANTKLVTQVGASVDAAGVTAAFEAWRTAVRGTVAGTGGFVADQLGAVLTATAAYTTTITALMALDVPLQTALDAAAIASKDKAGAIDPTKLAGLVAQAYATFGTSVSASVTSSAIAFVGGDGTLMTSAFISSKASY